VQRVPATDHRDGWQHLHRHRGGDAEADPVEVRPRPRRPGRSAPPAPWRRWPERQTRLKRPVEPAAQSPRAIRCSHQDALPASEQGTGRWRILRAKLLGAGAGRAAQAESSAGGPRWGGVIARRDFATYKRPKKHRNHRPPSATHFSLEKKILAGQLDELIGACSPTTSGQQWRSWPLRQWERVIRGRANSGPESHILGPFPRSGPDVAGGFKIQGCSPAGGALFARHRRFPCGVATAPCAHCKRNQAVVNVLISLSMPPRLAGDQHGPSRS